jgi:hypothetical protein
LYLLARNQKKKNKSPGTATIIHNFSIITTLIAELLHSLLSNNPLLIATAEATTTKRNWQLQNSSPTATIDQENKTHYRILPPP